MIETQGGINDLVAIVATPGLDGLYVGPNDLALALGYPTNPESDEPEVMAAVAGIVAAAKAHVKLSGIFCSGASGATRRIAEGFGLVTPGNDAMLLRAAMAAAVSGLRPS